MSLLSHESRFSKAPVNNISRSIFDRSNSLVTSFSAGKLVPIFLDEVIPGDTCTMDVSALVRMATPLYPVMDTAWCDLHFFFVPARLVWDNWKYFMGESKDAWDSAIDYEVPKVRVYPRPDNVSGYFGLPLGFADYSEPWLDVNALPFRAYQLIWNEWFRDQNLQDSVLINRGDSLSTNEDYDIVLPVNKYHDYFTSCLPQPQKGASVNIPIEVPGFSPVVGTTNYHNMGYVQIGGQSELPGLRALYSQSNTDGTASYLAIGNPASGNVAERASKSNLEVPLGEVISVGSINQLRQAFAVQRLLERDARGGTRYRELIKAHFGVDNGDLRMQVPEYLGGAHIPINITQVVQQSSTASEPSPLGEVGAMSKTADSASLFTKSFTEHGFILGFVSVRTDHTYLQGVPRLFDRNSRYDYYWPELANIGEQAVKTREIYGKADPSEVFGYQEAWADYRYKPNQCTGRMAFTSYESEDNKQLSPWHYADYYSDVPRLSDTWIRETDANVARTLAVSNTELFDQFIANFYFKARWARPMPVYSIPGLTGHI